MSADAVVQALAEMQEAGIPDDWASASLQRAEWVMRRLRRQRARLQEINDAETALIEEAKVWAAEERLAVSAELVEVERWLASWLAARIELDPHGPKTIALPSGKVSRRGQPIRVEVDDEETFIEWAKASGPAGMLRWPPQPDAQVDKSGIKAGIGQHLAYVQSEPGDGEEAELVWTTSGEKLPGIRVLRPEPKVTIDTK